MIGQGPTTLKLHTTFSRMMARYYLIVINIALLLSLLTNSERHHLSSGTCNVKPSTTTATNDNSAPCDGVLAALGVGIDHFNNMSQKSNSTYQVTQVQSATYEIEDAVTTRYNITASIAPATSCTTHDSNSSITRAKPNCTIDTSDSRLITLFVSHRHNSWSPNGFKLLKKDTSLHPAVTAALLLPMPGLPAQASATLIASTFQDSTSFIALVTGSAAVFVVLVVSVARKKTQYLRRQRLGYNHIKNNSQRFAV